MNLFEKGQTRAPADGERGGRFSKEDKKRARQRRKDRGKRDMPHIDSALDVVEPVKIPTPEKPKPRVAPVHKPVEVGTADTTQPNKSPVTPEEFAEGMVAVSPTVEAEPGQQEPVKKQSRENVRKIVESYSPAQIATLAEEVQHGNPNFLRHDGEILKPLMLLKQELRAVLRHQGYSKDAIDDFFSTDVTPIESAMNDAYAPVKRAFDPQAKRNAHDIFKQVQAASFDAILKAAHQHLSTHTPEPAARPQAADDSISTTEPSSRVGKPDSGKDESAIIGAPSTPPMSSIESTPSSAPTKPLSAEDELLRKVAQAEAEIDANNDDIEATLGEVNQSEAMQRMDKAHAAARDGLNQNNVSPEAEVVPADVEADGDSGESISSSTELEEYIDDMRTQITRLRKKLNKRNHEAGLLKQDAKNVSQEGYAKADKSLTNLRRRLNQLENDATDTEAKQAKLQEIRDEIAGSLHTYREDIRSHQESAAADTPPATEEDEGVDGEAEDEAQNDEAVALADELAKEDDMPLFAGKISEDLFEHADRKEQEDREAAEAKAKAEYAGDFQEPDESLLTPQVVAGSVEPQASEMSEVKELFHENPRAELLRSISAERQALREARQERDRMYKLFLTYKGKDGSKEQYETARQSFFAAEAAFAKKLQESLHGHSMYTEAEDDATRQEQDSKFRTLITERVVDRGVREETEMQKEHLDGRRKGLLGKIFNSSASQEKKDRRRMMMIAGAGVATGGLAFAFLAAKGLSKKALETAGLGHLANYVTFSAVGAGAIGGGWAGNKFVQVNRGRAERRLESEKQQATAEAAYISKMDTLRAALLTERKKAVWWDRNQKRFVIGGAVLGGAAGYLATGGVEDISEAVQGLSGDNVPVETPPSPTPEALSGNGGPIPIVEAVETEVLPNRSYDNLPAAPGNTPTSPTPEALSGNGGPIPIVEETEQATAGERLSPVTPDAQPVVSAELDSEILAESPPAEVIPGIEATETQFVQIPESGNIDTLSEAFYQQYLDGNLQGLPEGVTRAEFENKMWAAFHSLDNNPDVMKQMGLPNDLSARGDVDKVMPGQKINVAPLIDHMNSKSVEEIAETNYVTLDTDAAPETSLRPEPRQADLGATEQAPDTSPRPEPRPTPAEAMAAQAEIDSVLQAAGLAEVQPEPPTTPPEVPAPDVSESAEVDGVVNTQTEIPEDASEMTAEEIAERFAAQREAGPTLPITMEAVSVQLAERFGAGSSAAEAVQAEFASRLDELDSVRTEDVQGLLDRIADRVDITNRLAADFEASGMSDFEQRSANWQSVVSGGEASSDWEPALGLLQFLNQQAPLPAGNMPFKDMLEQTLQNADNLRITDNGLEVSGIMGTVAASYNQLPAVK